MIEEGGWIVSEYMNMLDVVAILSACFSPQAINSSRRPDQA